MTPQRKPIPERANRLGMYRRVLEAVKKAKENATIGDMAKAAGMAEDEFRKRLTGLRAMGVDIGKFRWSFIRNDVYGFAKELGFTIKPKKVKREE